MGGAVAIIFLMFKKEILKGATSKHAKNVFWLRNGSKQFRFQKTVDIPVGGGATDSIFATRTPQTFK